MFAYSALQIIDRLCLDIRNHTSEQFHTSLHPGPLICFQAHANAKSMVTTIKPQPLISTVNLTQTPLSQEQQYTSFYRVHEPFLICLPIPFFKSGKH